MPKSKVDLATCTFVERRNNLLLIGPTGVSKLHIAQPLGHSACRLGHSVLYTSGHDLLTQRRTARGDGSLDRKMLRSPLPTCSSSTPRATAAAALALIEGAAR
ncbi:MAG TPA: ATP-binding protein [Kofleriaceae bacterium]|nr:ATP-binding protein [Kofleriaceae bacterium]